MHQEISDTETPKAAPAAQGVVFLSVASFIALLGGYFFHIIAARWLLTADYGRLVLVLSIITWAENINGALLAGPVKAISEDHRRFHAAFSMAKKWFLPSGMIGGMLLFAAAPFIAAGFHDQALIALLILAAMEIPLTALLRLAVRYSTAMRLYSMASAINSIYSIGRTALGCSLILIGLGAIGAVAGQVAGTALAAGIGLVLLIRATRSLPVTNYPQMLSRSVSWAGYSLSYSLGVSTLLAMDMWCVKGLTPDPAQAGFYGAAFALARTPKFIMQGVAGAVFPRVSQALAQAKKTLAAGVTEEALRFLLIVMIPLCVLVGESSSEIVTFLFSEKYTQAGTALAILMAAISIYACFQLMLSIIEAADHPGLRTAFTIGLVPVALGLNFLLIPRYGINGAALATLVSMALGALAVIPAVLYYTGARLPFWTIIRCSIAGGIIYAGAIIWPAEGWVLVPKLAALGLVHILILFISGELGGKDIRAVAEAIPGRTGSYLTRLSKRFPR
ncbi:MAG: polysaccharide biosynthesis C-terminal domain-containing protein [Desulfobacterales bacterium]